MNTPPRQESSQPERPESRGPADVSVVGDDNIVVGSRATGNAVGPGSSVRTIHIESPPILLAVVLVLFAVILVAVLLAGSHDAVRIAMAGMVLAALFVLTATFSLWTRKTAAVHDASMAYQGKGEAERRRGLLDATDRMWVHDSLGQSLRAELRLEIGLVDQPDAVLEAWGSQTFRRLDEGERLPAGTRLSSVMGGDQGPRRLLLLGAPGAGKTTFLLGLAEDQVAAARADPDAPVPLVLLLSTWVDTEGGLAAWICAEALRRHVIDTPLTMKWLRTGAVLLLLDGLDEVDAAARLHCLESIQEFCSDPRYVDCGLVLTSRTSEFAEMRQRLRVDGALAVLPLSDEQVEGVLAAGDVGTAALRTAAGRDPELAELLRTPLMLGVAVLAFAHRPSGTSLPAGDYRRALFGLYVHRMLHRVRALRSRADATTVTPAPEPADVYYHLVWLARLMSRQGQTIFYPDLLTPLWLPDRLPTWPLTRQRGLRARVARVLGWDHTSTGTVGGRLAALAGALSAAPLGLLVHGATGAAVAAAAGAAVLGGGVALAFGVLFQSSTAELLTAPVVGKDAYDIFAATSWRWSLRTGARRRLPGVLLFGLFVAAVLPAAGAGLSASLAVAAVIAAGGLLSGGSVPDHERPPAVPGSALEASMRRLVNLLVILVAVVGAGVVALAATGGPWYALVAAMPATAAFMMSAGPGRAWLRFRAARYGAKHSRLLPEDLTALLRHGEDRVLLRRVGGGYLFLHRDLQEYLVECDPEDLREPRLLHA